MTRLLLTPIILLAAASPAHARPPLLKMSDARQMTEQWANTPKPTKHKVPWCHRSYRRVITCRLITYNATLPSLGLQGGQWLEMVTIRRRKHFAVLTSNLFRGALKQRVG